MKRLWQQPGRWSRLLVLVACALIVVMYLRNDDNDRRPDAMRGNGEYIPVLARGDGHMMYLMARSTALDLDWNFDNDLQRFGDPWGQPRNAEGHKQIPHPLGPPLIWTPLIWIAEAGAKIVGAFGADVPRHGYTEWHQRFVFLSSVLAALAAVLLGRKLAIRIIGGTWAATYATIAVLLGTSLTYYATYMPSYGHALDAGICAAFLATWALTIGRLEWRRFVVLGALLGVAMLIRVQDVAFGIVVAIEVAAVIVGDLRSGAIDWRVRALLWLGAGALVLVVALVVFSPQLYYWHVVYDDWLSLPQGKHYTRPGSPMILELLFSSRNGWFSTTPIAYLAVLGLACVPRRARMIGFAFAAVVALQVYLNSTIFDWWGMSSWGQRRLCSVSIVLVVGLAALLWRLGRLAARIPRVPRAVWHVLAIAVLLPMIAWNVWRVRDLKSGKAAPADLVQTCCENLPKRFRTPLAWVYYRVGNPFQFPANAWFAIKHKVDIRRWDEAVGNYPLMPPAHTLRDDKMFYEYGGWRIGLPKAEPYLIGGWSAVREAEGRQFRWTLEPEVRAIVPNLMPYGQRLTLWVAPGFARYITVRWDDEVVASTLLTGGWQRVAFEIEDMTVGEHELSIESAVGPFHGGNGFPLARKPVGVAVHILEVEFLPP